jgi:hypothetical protein
MKKKKKRKKKKKKKNSETLRTKKRNNPKRKYQKTNHKVTHHLRPLRVHPQKLLLSHLPNAKSNSKLSLPKLPKPNDPSQ